MNVNIDYLRRDPFFGKTDDRNVSSKVEKEIAMELAADYIERNGESE